MNHSRCGEKKVLSIDIGKTHLGLCLICTDAAAAWDHYHIHQWLCIDMTTPTTTTTTTTHSKKRKRKQCTFNTIDTIITNFHSNEHINALLENTDTKEPTQILIEQQNGSREMFALCHSVYTFFRAYKHLDVEIVSPTLKLKLAREQFGIRPSHYTNIKRQTLRNKQAVIDACEVHLQDIVD